MDQTQSSQATTNTDTRIFQNIIFAVAVLLVVVATILAVFDTKIGIVSTIYGAAALCLLFAFLSHFKRLEYWGFKAELNEVKVDQHEMKKDIGLVQVLSFAGIVSKYELKHLYKLAELSYYLTYSQDLKNELKRLDDFGFILPNKGMGLNTIDTKFGADINKYDAKDKTKFNLKDYVHITTYGEKYIELAKKLGLPERP